MAITTYSQNLIETFVGYECSNGLFPFANIEPEDWFSQPKTLTLEELETEDYADLLL